MLNGPGQTWQISRRFLAGEISIEEAARQIAAQVPTDEIWALTCGSNLPGHDLSEKERAKANELLARILELIRNKI